MHTIDHVAIRVDDLDLAQEWYEKMLGAELQYKDRFYRRMLLNNTTLALVDKNRYPYDHIGVLVQNIDELPNVGERIEHRDGTIGVYVKDPFGHVVEYIWYSPETRGNFIKQEEKNELG